MNSSNLNLALRVLDAEREKEFSPERNSFRNGSPNLRADGIPQIFQFIHAPEVHERVAFAVYAGAANFQPDSKSKREARMKLTVKSAAAALLAASLVVSYAQTGSSTAPAKKHAAARKTPAASHGRRADSIAAQELQGQIDSLKSRSCRQGCAAEAGAADGDRCAGRGRQGGS